MGSAETFRETVCIDMPDDLVPKLPANCPQCGQPLRYVTTISSGGMTYRPGVTITTESDVHIYLCAQDGQFRVTAKDGLWPVPA